MLLKENIHGLHPTISRVKQLVRGRVAFMPDGGSLVSGLGGGVFMSHRHDVQRTDHLGESNGGENTVKYQIMPNKE